SSAEVILQNGSTDPSVTGYGWSEAGWESVSPNVYFAADGTQTVRVQQREDGAIVDQIVLSPDQYVSTPPGPRDNDTLILPANDGSASPPPPPPPPPRPRSRGFDGHPADQTGSLGAGLGKWCRNPGAAAERCGAKRPEHAG